MDRQTGKKGCRAVFVWGILTRKISCQSLIGVEKIRFQQKCFMQTSREASLLKVNEKMSILLVSLIIWMIP